MKSKICTFHENSFGYFLIKTANFALKVALEKGQGGSA